MSTPSTQPAQAPTLAPEQVAAALGFVDELRVIALRHVEAQERIAEALETLALSLRQDGDDNGSAAVSEVIDDYCTRVAAELAAENEQ